MRESIRKLVRIGVAHISKVGASTTPCFDIFNCPYNAEPRNMELMERVEMGRSKAYQMPRQEPKLLQE